MKRVSLQINDEFYAFAQEQAVLFEYIDTNDYLNGLLNMALLTAVVDADELENMPHPSPLISVSTEQHQITLLAGQYCKHDPLAELEEDEGGGMRHKDEDEGLPPEALGDNADLDDDIPF